MDNDYYSLPAHKDSAAPAPSEPSQIIISDQADATRAKRLSEQHKLTPLTLKKSASTPATSELLAQAFANPNTVSPHDQMLSEQQRKYQQKLDERRQRDHYLTLKRTFGTSHYDNLIGIKALINYRDDSYPLYDGNDAIQERLEVLRRKNVMLLVSHLDIPAMELQKIMQLYQELIMDGVIRSDSKIEMVWVPIIDRTVSSDKDPELKARYHETQMKMPWYSVSDPFMVEPGAVKFIREHLKFNEKPILVLLDPRGRISNYNAIDMFWIWGPEASPYDEVRERELWRDARWSMDLLVDSIDPTVRGWLTNDKYICVFGGDNIEWIKNFTTIARSVTKQLDIQLELLCVGKSTSKEFVKINNDIIEYVYIYMSPKLHPYFFWERLKRIWNAREKRGLPTVNDAIMQKIGSVLTYDNSDRPWAVFGKGQYGEMAMQEGELMYKVLEEFSEWGVNINLNNNFVKVLDEVLRDRRPENISPTFVYPGSTAPTQNEYSLAQKKSTSNPTTSEPLAKAFAKPNTVSPHDQMLSEPNARKHPIHLMSNVAPFTSHLARKEHHKFAVTEETAVVRSIQSYRAPDGVEYAYDSKYVFNVIEYTIIRVCAVIPVVKHRIAAVDGRRLDKLQGENVMKRDTLSDLRDELADPIHNISALLINHCEDGDERKVSEKIFQSLAPYPFEAKVVISLAAFTMQYAEFWLLAEHHRSHPLAGSVPLLMEIPEIMSNLEVFCPKFKAITDVVDAMLDVTRTIITLVFEKRYITRDAKDDDSTLQQLSVIPTACYWVIKSIVACSAILLNLMATGHEYLTSQVNWELRSLGHKLGKSKSLLDEQWRKYQHKVDEVRQHELYLALKRIFGTSHDDNLICIKALINNRDDPYPLYEGYDAIKKRLEVLMRKNVMLLVSHLDIPDLLLEILEIFYHESRQYTDTRMNSRIEMVWVPIIDNRTVSSLEAPELKERYHETQKKMSWYSVSDPFMVEPGAAKFIRDQWKFDEKPILVVLDPHGRVSNYDANNMLWIWGFQASPFNEARERELWRDARWSMDLLVEGIDTTVQSWLICNEYICVFGGENIEWIKKFTTMARSVTKQLGIPLEFLYVGKSTSKGLVKRNNELIARMGIYTMPEIQTWLFWERLKCMWNSTEKCGLSTENYAIMQKIISVLIYDSSDRPWAVFGIGQYGEMAMQEGELMYKVLEEFPKWRANIDQDNNFVKVLDDVLKDRRPENICWKLLYPGSSTRAPPKIEWSECEKPMGKQLMYSCCSD